jgi:hypothetical protein
VDDSIVEGVEYSATAGATAGAVTLTVQRHVIHFVREVIPDGQMAGLMGHRPVPSVESFDFEMPVAQARHLLDDLAVAVERASRGRGA